MMEFIKTYERVWKKAGIVAGVFLAMKYLVPVTAPFLVAALAAWWLRPFFARLEKWSRLKPGILAVLFLVLVLAAGGMVLYFLGGQLMELGSEFLADQTGSGGGAAGGPGEPRLVFVRQMLVDCCEAAERLLGIPAGRAEQLVLTQVQVWQEQIQGNWLTEAFGGSFAAMKGAGKAAAALLVGVIAFVMLCGDFEKIKEEASDSQLLVRAAALGSGIKEAIGSYVKAQCIIIGMVMVICVLGFLLVGSSYGVVLGIGTGLLDALPVLGTGLVILPWMILALIRGEYVTALILGITYGACTLTREILEPRLVGKRLGLFPVLVLLSVYVGVKVYGTGGILLGPLSLLVIQELWKRC